MRLELAGVRRRFGTTEVLKGIDLTIAPGSRVALVGPNGSGKSTLLRSLLGLLACEGTVRLDGIDPFVERVKVAERLAYVPQLAPPLAASVGELVAFAEATRELEKDAVSFACTALGLDLAEVRARPFRGLSGGMKQKLLLALAFAARPRLLVLDEPTASLDALSRDRFFHLFDALAPECTLLLCSHRLEELRQLATSVVELDEGRVAFAGPVETLLARRAASVVEVCVDGDACANWLQGRGFRAGAPGWWRRSLTPAEKLTLVPELASVLGGALRNLLVHDVESLEGSR